MANNPFECYKKAVRFCGRCPDGLRPKGNITVASFVEKGTVIRTDTADIFKADILAAEKAGKAYVLRKTNGSYDGGTEVTGPGRGRNSESTTGIRHTAQIQDWDYVMNTQCDNNFWDDMRKTADQYDFYFVTDTRGWKVTGTTIKIFPQGGIENDVNTFVTGNITISWDKLEVVCNFPALHSDFEECPECDFKEATSNSAETITSATTTQQLAITIAPGADFDVDFEFDCCIKEILADTECPLPDWLTLTTENDCITGETVHKVAGTAPTPAPDPACLTFNLLATGCTGLDGYVQVTVNVA